MNWQDLVSICAGLGVMAFIFYLFRKLDQITELLEAIIVLLGESAE